MATEKKYKEKKLNDMLSHNVEQTKEENRNTQRKVMSRYIGTYGLPESSGAGSPPQYDKNDVIFPP
jgi:hypothetical protein